MINISAEVLLAYLAAFFGIAGLAPCLLGIVLAPWIIGKVDECLGILYPNDEILFKSYPVSLGRLCSYGLMVMLRNSKFVQKRVFMGRGDRVRAVDEAPRWVLFVTQWIYGTFAIFGVLAVFFGGLMLLVEKV